MFNNNNVNYLFARPSYFASGKFKTRFCSWCLRRKCAKPTYLSLDWTRLDILSDVQMLTLHLLISPLLVIKFGPFSLRLLPLSFTYLHVSTYISLLCLYVEYINY